MQKPEAKSPNAQIRENSCSSDIRYIFNSFNPLLGVGPEVLGIRDRAGRHWEAAATQSRIVAVVHQSSHTFAGWEASIGVEEAVESTDLRNKAADKVVVGGKAVIASS